VAVEAAWSKVVREIGEDPVLVIAATHSKRAINNLARFKPHLLSHELNDAVQFERSILFYVDAHSRVRSSTLAPLLVSESSSNSSSSPSSTVANSSSSSILEM
jgi:hypothetical protein